MTNSQGTIADAATMMAKNQKAVRHEATTKMTPAKAGQRPRPTRLDDSTRAVAVARRRTNQLATAVGATRCSRLNMTVRPTVNATANMKRFCIDAMPANDTAMASEPTVSSTRAP